MTPLVAGMFLDMTWALLAFTRPEINVDMSYLLKQFYELSFYKTRKLS